MHERQADSIEQAQALCRTEFFWWVTYLADYSEFDFLWKPVPWQAHQRHAWPCQHQPDAKFYLVPKSWDSKETNYHSSPVIHLLADSSCWSVPDWIDPTSIDSRWSPDPCDPPYIYEFPVEWGWDQVGGPQYQVPGATDIKYVNDFVARTKHNPNTWYQHCEVQWPDEVSRWRPCPTDPPYDYVFGNQWYPAEIMPTVEYRMPGAQGKKYMPMTVRLPERHHNRWHTLYDCEWDYSWVSDPGDPPYIYVWGNQWWPAEKMPTVEYHVPGATERKYMDRPAQLLSDTTHWSVPELVDPLSVDYSWRPDPGDPPYIYEFATQWQPNGGARYVLPGATEVKYINIQHRRLPDRSAWKLLEYIADFDYSWHPDNTEPPYNYVFGNQHWPGTDMPTTMYCMPSAEQEKFIDAPVARLGGQIANWEFMEDIDLDAWDWSWQPNPQDPPYIYVFGNQWNPPELKASLKYHVEGATEVKYMDRRTCRLPQPDLFESHLPVAEFDYSWEPNPTDPPMTYVFGNQWNEGVLEPTVTYSTGGTETKYVNDIVAKIAPNYGDQWRVLDKIEEFDYSWRPNPTDPPYIYVFGNQWLSPEVRPALEYHVVGATEHKYLTHPQARRRGNPELFEQLYPADFDWSWEPEPGSPPYIYVFGNQYHSAEVMPTVTYTVPGATERKYMDVPAVLTPCSDHWRQLVPCEWDYTWRPEPGSPAYIYVFGNQWWSAEKMPTMEYHMPGATERKYMTAPLAQLPVDMSNWHIPPYVDVTDIDFSWVPDPGESPYIYQFATQHQKTGGPQYRVPGATEFKYVDWMRAEVRREAAPIFEIDHLDGHAGHIPDTVRRVRYFDNYRDTLIRLAKSLQGEYEHVWVCSSICDYSNFDFSWHPETWQSTMLHVFASDEQKFGDTFYMHVPTFAERAEKKALLEWYAVNYVPRIRVPRRPVPVFVHNQDSHVEAVKAADFTAPLALFTVEPHMDRALVTVPLWRRETKAIVPISRGASAVIVPKAAVGDIKTQLYDYPNIDKTKTFLKSHPLDIVFIANGEPNADQHFGHLNSVTYNLANRLHRVDGINGRVAAYHAAAEVSKTPWFFAVFAKLEVNAKFDWAWQPDRMQQPKHYIFHAQNPVNGLVYGHQAMIAYNRALTLANPGLGLDFTLDSPHEVVPIVSGIAYYNHSAWMAWRTAFREVLKLKASLPDVENEFRLERWLSVNPDGQTIVYEDWSRWGAEDAVEFYDSVSGDFAELRKSYDWAWLASYALLKRNLTVND